MLIMRESLENVGQRPDLSMHIAVSSHCNLSPQMRHYQPERAYVSILMYIVYQYTWFCFLLSYFE